MLTDMNKDDKKKNWSIYILGSLVFIFVLTLGYSFVLIKWVGFAESAGTYGDQFGGLNAVFSGLAFAALIVALLMQHEELKTTQREVRVQADLIRQQTAVDTFYRLVSLYRDVVGKLGKDPWRNPIFAGEDKPQPHLRPVLKCAEAVLGYICSEEIIDKKFYSDVFRAVLSKDELHLLCKYKKLWPKEKASLLLSELDFDTGENEFRWTDCG